jgi:hypothetical protein
MTNRNERRRAEVIAKRMTFAEFHKLNSICAWAGCTEIADHQKGKIYLPKDWTALLMFWSENAPRDIVRDLSASNMLRDCVLCPKHTAALQLQLKSLRLEGSTSH